jgi:hypothetical protein
VQELRQGPAVRGRDDGPLHAARHQLQVRTRGPPALHVEAVRDGEEPISFGPSAALADYRSCWRLQTVTAQDAPGIHDAPHAERQPSMASPGGRHTSPSARTLSPSASAVASDGVTESRSTEQTKTTKSTNEALFFYLGLLTGLFTPS